MDTNRAIYGTIPRNPNPKSHPIHDTTVDRLDTWLLERIESRVHLSNSTPTRFFSPFESFSKLSQLSRSTSSSSSSSHARGSIPWIPRCVVSGSIESLTRHHRSIFSWRSSSIFRVVRGIQPPRSISRERDTIEGGENGNYARGYICFSPSLC